VDRKWTPARSSFALLGLKNQHVQMEGWKRHVWSLDAQDIRACLRGEKGAVRDAVREGGGKEKYARSEELCPGLSQLRVHA
jgi:hypothetical protein